MTYLVERLAELRRHLDHLKSIRPRVTGRDALSRDLSLHNDVLFSLLTVCRSSSTSPESSPLGAATATRTTPKRFET